MRRHINTNSRGLLEATPNENRPLYTTQVNYLHRLVKDFLQRGDIWRDICAAAGDGFNPGLRLFNSKMAMLTVQSKINFKTDDFWVTIVFAFSYAIRADPAFSTLHVSLLNEIDHIASQRGPWLFEQRDSTVGISPGHWNQEGLTAGVSEAHWVHSKWKATSFLVFATQCQLSAYVEATLRTMSPSRIASSVSYLLHLAILEPCLCDPPTIRSGIGADGCNMALVKLLLNHGADPNAKFDHGGKKTSVWGYVLRQNKIKRCSWNGRNASTCVEGKKGVRSSIFNKRTKSAIDTTSDNNTSQGQDTTHAKQGGGINTTVTEAQEAGPSTSAQNKESRDQTRVTWWKRLTWRS
jgi:hypothetical protein